MAREQKYKKIEKETIQIAEYILENDLTLREAEKILNIPRPTLYWRIKHILPRCNSTLLVKLEAMFETNKNKILEGTDFD
ncbi:hypothetical protein K144316041_p21580 (plasmid) [Clostridium tetani]|uniref:sporulation transcriptional regulator SpoIIID n=1 Tax=Clostridium tetani TaxID=1513 RepID=UPI002953835F|nr:sporulation transcriptional regulator SpoIIID [Clostridium tetani]BDR74319.1 hypothetical protein K144316041_p21580 [Clostridium tetani]